MRWLFAHQGGWDEFVVFIVPAVLAVLGLRWAERRARRRAEQAGRPFPAEPDEPHRLREDEGRI